MVTLPAMLAGAIADAAHVGGQDALRGAGELACWMCSTASVATQHEHLQHCASAFFSSLKPWAADVGLNLRCCWPVRVFWHQRLQICQHLHHLSCLPACASYLHKRQRLHMNNEILDQHSCAYLFSQRKHAKCLSIAVES